MALKHVTTSYLLKTVQGLPVRSRDVLTIGAGKRLSVRVPVGSNDGWLNEITVKQVPSGSGGGTAVGFSVEVLDSATPYHNGDPTVDTVEANYNAATGLDPEMFQVIDKLTATAGNAAKQRNAELGWPYVNADQPNQTINLPYLYVCIIPTNSGDITKWQLSVTITKETGS